MKSKIRACELNNSWACLWLGDYYKHENVKDIRYSKAKKYNEKACNFGKAQGCHNLAITYLKFKPTMLKKEEARVYFKKACELGYGPSCTRLATEYNHSRYFGSGNLVKANEYYKKACKHHDGQGL